MTAAFVDAHLHLQDPRFGGRVGEVLGRAERAGVARFFCNAVDEGDWPLVTGLAAAHPTVIPFLGIHPWHSGRARDGWQDRLTACAAALPGPVGIGETGLDRSRTVDFGVQKQVFAAHLALAAAHGWPLALHCVRAWGTLVETLSSFAAERRLPPVMVHSFNGASETMRRLTDLGCYISYSEALFDPDSETLRETLRRTPLNLLLLETDAPFCKDPGRKNTEGAGPGTEPAAVAGLYHWAARLLDTGVDELRARIWDNATVFTNENAAGR